MTIIVPDQIVKADIDRLTNQLWKLIPMRENNEKWEIHLEGLIVEIAGLNELVFNIDEKLLVLLSKLKGLLKEETSFYLYRKTVFECISLLRETRL